uniref:Activating signal cointegrator 1 complex subunit 3 n=1 Tax=Globodera pallida TaxID=36090 RepID=A0A183BX03_GLOPA
MEDITATSNASNPVLIEINEHDTDDNNSEIVGGTDHCSDGVTKVAFKQRPSSRKRNEANMQPKPSPRPAVPLPPSRFPHLRCNQLPTIKEEPAHRELDGIDEGLFTSHLKENVKKDQKVAEKIFNYSINNETGPSSSISNFGAQNFQPEFRPELIVWKNKFYEVDEEEDEQFAWDDVMRKAEQLNLSDPTTSEGHKTVNVRVGETKMALPEGSTSRRMEHCDELFIPALGAGNKAFLDNFPRIRIDTMDEFGQRLFEGIESLNVIQSQVYDRAYNSLDNLLICAPTGAGKTNIALLTAAKTIKDNVNITTGRINKDAFKIIYLAPMKALASEMTKNFSNRLAKLGLKVRELTGDSQLSRREISETQMLVLTPEKWDVITRKSDDEELSQLVRLIIIDEVHLLHDERGPVIESIVARTLRQVEVYHQNLRIVGLSATLPNFEDVAQFLRVDPTRGLYHFDARFRPVPLAQSFLGVRDSDSAGAVLQREREKALRRGEKPPTSVPQKQLMTQKEKIDEVCFRQCVHFLRDKHQVLVFVHSRNATGLLARTFMAKAALANQRELFEVEQARATTNSYLKATKAMRNAQMEAKIRPITCTIIQIEALLMPNFVWNNALLGSAQHYWVIVEDSDANIILHYENFLLTKKIALSGEPQRLIFTIPVNEDQIQHTYLLRVASDQFVLDDTVVPLSLALSILPSAIKQHTDLLDLDPLPLSALGNPRFQSLYTFEFFNPVQTQVFHTLYATDENTLIGAPTSSGKTLCAELAIFRLFNGRPGKKCVYIAPLKALVRERVLDWEDKFHRKLGHSIVEVSGDNTPEVHELNKASILITTPEKWDGITRYAEAKRYVKQVELLIIDEIHLLGVERGAVLEAIITRIKSMARRRELAKLPIRIVGLSTALANAGDVAEWIGVRDHGLFNFRPSVRPVPVQVHIQGFPGQHYCPRMALMNKPAYQYIKQFSPIKPVLVFVASRRQTRLTAMALLGLLQREGEHSHQQWLGMDQTELERTLTHVRDDNLRLTLTYGVGIHHAGLHVAERALVERLFVERKIQVLVATATLAWGINVPAHLVIVKGTEYYDGKTHKYIDFPVTDVLQMIGRAGRPQFDTSAVAVVFVQDTKKNFYKRFLYEPFPLESNLLPVLANHVNAEICAGLITNRQQVVEYLAGTYLYRRLFANPAYYGLEQLNDKELTTFLSTTVDQCLGELSLSGCVVLDEEENGTVDPTPLGRIASKYYLQHLTMRHFKAHIHGAMSVEELLQCLADCPEYEEIPVRHNEDQINSEIQSFLPIKLASSDWGSPHVKTNLLYQAHFSRMKLPVDYITDQRSIIESCIRIIQAMFDTCLEFALLDTAINVLVLLQQIYQARWYSDHPLLCLPHLSAHSIDGIGPFCSIPQLQHQLGIYALDNVDAMKKSEFERQHIRKLRKNSILKEFETKELLEGLMRWPVLRIENAILQDQLLERAVDLKAEKMEQLELRCGHLFKLRLTLRLHGPSRFQSDAFCPKYPKKRRAGWVLLMGDAMSKQIWSVERVPPWDKTTDNKFVRLSFSTPDEP